MAQIAADKRDIDFNLYEVFKCQECTKYSRYKGFNKKTFEMIVSEARNFGLKEILPTYTEGDRQGVSFKAGEVTVPDCYRRAFELFAREWTAMTDTPEFGGQGLPYIVAQAANEYLSGINISLTTYAVQGHGVGQMIEVYGTDKQKELFLENLYTAKWGGSMLITEPDAGTNVGAMTTTATKNSDGTYSLTGYKHFISVGEHDLTENIIHAVLARVEGAPAGTRGLSLFLVPKYWVNDDGGLSERNGIVCTAIEDKLGIHGMVTCSFGLGDKIPCRGILLGEENKGINVMFTMMNEERLLVGGQAFGNASVAYMYALDYARTRLQGRGKGDEQIPIINHPDVKRMLLTMKALVDGMRSSVYYVAQCFDYLHCAETEEDKIFQKDMIGFLTPLIKAYCSDRGFEVCATAMQVYGGYGYMKDYPIEQLLRDSKIVSLYEGTNGIQALDLIVRKLPMKDGKIFRAILTNIRNIIFDAKKISNLSSIAEDLNIAVNSLENIAGKTVERLKSEPQKAFVFATPFLEIMGDIIISWMLLKRATIAASAIEKGAKDKNISFYNGQIMTAQFFIKTILPVTMGKMNVVNAGNTVAFDFSDTSFGG